MNHLFLVLMTILAAFAIFRNDCWAEESILSLFPEYEKRMTDFEAEITKFKAEISALKRSVSLTGCVSRHRYRLVGRILKFDDIRSSVGINDITGYKSRGVFVAEEKGLYLVIVSVMVADSSGEVGIFKNGNVVTKMYKGSDSSTWETGSTSATLLLEKGDSVWVQVVTATYIGHNQNSCLTIVKIQ